MGVKKGTVFCVLVLGIALVFSGCENAGAGAGETADDEAEEEEAEEEGEEEIVTPIPWLSLSVDGEEVDLSETFNVGDVQIGGIGTTTFTLENVSEDAVSLDGAEAGVTLAGDHASQFDVDLEGVSTEIAAGASIDIELVYTPTGPTIETRTAMLSIRSETDGEAYTLTLNGGATGALIVVSEGETQLASEDLVDFGDISSEDGIVEKTFSVRNDGNLDLVLTGVNLSGWATDNNDTPIHDKFYWTEMPVIAAINPGDTREFLIRIDTNSDAEPTVEATLTINSNAAADMQVFTVDLSANLGY